MSPSGVTNQCVAGALATWAAMHLVDPRWNHLAPLFGNAIDLFGVARAEGFQLDSHPTPGAMVVFAAPTASSAISPPCAPCRGDRYEVVEQDFIDLNPTRSHIGRASIFGRWRGWIRRWWGSSWRRPSDEAAARCGR